MTTTLSNGTTTITPDLVTGWTSVQESKTQLHAIIGSASPDVTTRPAMTRTGTLGLLFKTETAANNCRTLHTAAGVFTLTSTDLNNINMSYVVRGNVTVKLDDQTLKTWLVEVDFQEVTT